MKPLAERADSVDETIEQLRKAVKVIPLLQVFFQNRPAIRIGGFHGSGNYEYVLQGDNFEALGKAASTLQKAMEGVAGLRDIHSDLELNNPTIDVHIESDRAAALNVSVADIQRTLYAASSQELRIGKE